jgi:hypothetical protein
MTGCRVNARWILGRRLGTLGVVLCCASGCGGRTSLESGGRPADLGPIRDLAVTDDRLREDLVVDVPGVADGDMTQQEVCPRPSPGYFLTTRPATSVDLGAPGVTSVTAAGAGDEVLVAFGWITPPAAPAGLPTEVVEVHVLSPLGDRAEKRLSLDGVQYPALAVGASGALASTTGAFALVVHDVITDEPIFHALDASGAMLWSARLAAEMSGIVRPAFNGQDWVVAWSAYPAAQSVIGTLAPDGNVVPWLEIGRAADSPAIASDPVSGTTWLLVRTSHEDNPNASSPRLLAFDRQGQVIGSPEGTLLDDPAFQSVPSFSPRVALGVTPPGAGMAGESLPFIVGQFDVAGSGTSFGIATYYSLDPPALGGAYKELGPDLVDFAVQAVGQPAPLDPSAWFGLASIRSGGNAPSGLYFAGFFEGGVPGPETLPFAGGLGGVGLGPCGLLVAAADPGAPGRLLTTLVQLAAPAPP